MIGRIGSVVSAGLAFGLVVQGCGKAEVDGNAGSETHWMATCERSSDCDLGECLCGVCTVACTTVRDCPVPLDVCLDRKADGVACKQSICQGSTPGQSLEALGSQQDPQQHLIAGCDGERPTKLARIVPSEADVLADPAIGVDSHVVPELGGGFLLIGPGGGVIRLAADGSFVRELPAPFEHGAVTDKVTDASVLPDGSVFLAGHTEAGAWVGKVDANWQLLWEKQLPYVSTEHVDVETFPDGRAIVAGTGHLPVAPGAPEPLIGLAFWAQLTSEGVIEHNQAVDFGELNAHYLGMLATFDTTFHLAVASSTGITLISGDADGNYTSALLTGVSQEVKDVAGLPDGRVAVLSSTELLLADDTGVLSEYSLDDGVTVPYALGFDAMRDELVIVGGRATASSPIPGRWLSSVNMSNATLWELQRAPWPVGLDDPSQTNVYGNLLYDVAVDAGGNILGLGTFRGTDLDLQWVGNATCGG